jgi:predicted transcriptional regulator
MRVHIYVDDDLLRELDELVGPRGRSPFITEAVRRAVDAERRWRKIESAFGKIGDTGHEWDEDPAAWVRSQRRADARRVG